MLEEESEVTPKCSISSYSLQDNSLAEGLSERLEARKKALGFVPQKELVQVVTTNISCVWHQAFFLTMICFPPE